MRISDIPENAFGLFDGELRVDFILTPIQVTVIDVTVHARRFRDASGKRMIAK